MTTNTTRLSLLLGLAFFCLTAASPGFAAVKFTGVNLAGAEFSPTTLPGTLGNNYGYPTTADVNYFRGKGMNCFRLPFLWERLQPTLNNAFDSVQAGYISNFVSYATGQGTYVVLDPHNYARYSISGTISIIGSAAVPITAYSNFWGRLADTYRTNDKVIFNLMNEPHDMSSETWRDAANAAIKAIRNTGATNLILVPGNNWTSPWNWALSFSGNTANSTRMLDIVDSGNNFAFDVHQYLNLSGDGTTGDIANNNTSTGVTRISAFTSWCKTNGKKAFLGEYGVANTNITTTPLIGGSALTNMLNYIQNNSDVWIGWTWWAAGPRWPSDYIFLLEPGGATLDKPAMNILTNYLPVVISPPGVPTMSVATAITSSGFTVNWQTVSGTTGYRLDVSTVNTFNSYVAGYQDLDVGNVLSKAVTGVNGSTTYFFRVRAYNAGGSGGNSGVLTATTTASPPPTISATRSGSNIIFTWPSTYTGYTLVYRTNLTAGTWLTNAGAPVLVNNQYTVTNPVGSGRTFYRLKK